MLLVAFCLTLSPRLITLEIPALPATKALERLSETGGVPLFASAEMASDVVCIRAREASLEDLKRQIAKATGAEWHEKDGKWILSRPQALDRSQYAEEIASKAKEIASLIAARPAPPKFDESLAIGIIGQAEVVVGRLHERFVTEEHMKAREQLQALISQGPVPRLAERLLKSLDPSRLAKLQTGETLVFSNTPTRMQLPLNPEVAQSCLSEFAKEQTIFRRVIERGSPVTYSKADDMRYWTWETEPTVSQIFLKVEMVRQTGLPRFVLKLANDQGDVRGWTSFSLNRAAKQKEQNSRWAGEFELSKDAVEWCRLYFLMHNFMEVDTETKQPVASLVAPWLDRHSNPEQNEPLSFAAGDAFLKLAESQGKNLVACVPEQAMLWYEGVNSKQTAQSFTDFAVAKWGGQFEKDGDWIRFRPKYFSEGRRFRLDRGALGKFFRAVRASGSIRIDDAAQYAFSTKSPLLLEIWDRTAIGYTEKLQGDFASNETASWYRRGILRVLGALSPVQRKGLLNGGSLPVSQLSQAAKEELERFTYGEQMTGRGIFGRLVYATGERNVSEVLGSLKTEATVALGNGIPANTILKVTPERRDMIVMRYEEMPSYNLTLSPDTLGYQLAESEVQEDKSKPIYDMGTARMYTINVVYGPGMESLDELPEVERQKRTRLKSVDEMPAHLRERIQASYKKNKEALLKAKERTKNGAPPPP